MKQVIKDIHCEVVSVNNISPNKYFGARIKGEVYTLEFEINGFIFRPTDMLDTSGHSGFHSTPAEAIEKALTVGKTEVFQFDSIRELAAFIADNAKSWKKIWQLYSVSLEYRS